jgi:hypothetical protein
MSSCSVVCWNLPDGQWREKDGEEAEEDVAAAHDAGV